MEALNEIKTWLEQNSKTPETRATASQNKGRQVLFRGDKGHTKLAAAEKLATDTGKELLRVDLSKLVSKYIGETEKNLNAVFEKAANKNYILFFDEADALFGKRTEVKDAHDRYANQEVSYLLQRLESFPGLAILSTNQKSTIDPAFVRRMHSHILFD